MATTEPERISMPRGYLWLMQLGCPVVGFGLGFAVRPLFRWVSSTLQSAPAPLRIAAQIPTPWLVPILTVAGVAAGYWLAQQAKRESLTLTVDSASLVAAYRGVERYIQRAHIGSVCTDPKDLIVLTPDGREIFRAPATDLSTSELAATLRRHGYPWQGERDPHETEYERWIDGHPDLSESAHALLRARRGALDAKNRAQVENLHAQLQEGGVIVRDRNKSQEYRRLATKNDDVS